jgi:hypothetical protein
MAQQATSRMSTISRALPWASALVLIAGVVAFAVVKLGGNDNSTSKTSVSPAPPPAASKPATSKTTPATNTKGGTATAGRVKFDAAAKRVAGTFILTAVQRKHLDRAWPISGPAIREGSNYKEWLTGNIAVIPFLHEIAGAKFNVQSLGRKTATVQVALIPKNSKVRAQFFTMTLLKVGAGKGQHWVVNGWVPIGGFAVPSIGSGGQ